MTISHGASETLFSNSAALIRRIKTPSEPILYVEWTGFQATFNEDVKTSRDLILKLIREGKYRLLLSRYDRLEGVTLDFLDWCNAYFYPECYKAGLQAKVIIQDDEKSRYSNHRLLYDSPSLTQDGIVGKLHIVICPDEKTAMNKLYELTKALDTA